MPYIKPELRPPIDQSVFFLIDNIHHLIDKDSSKLDGILNYTIITIIIKAFKLPEYESYQVYERIDGLLSKISKEIDKRFVSPYEEKKMKENGDII